MHPKIGLCKFFDKFQVWVKDHLSSDTVAEKLFRARVQGATPVADVALVLQLGQSDFTFFMMFRLHVMQNINLLRIQRIHMSHCVVSEPDEEFRQ